MNIRACSVLVLVFSAAVMAQTEESTTVTTKTTETGYNLVSPFVMEDAVLVPDGGLELRFNFGWVTDDYADVDGDDDFAMGAGLYWGFAPNWELSFDTVFAVGDGRNETDGVRGFDGDGDVTVGLSWAFLEQSGYVPAMTLETKVRVKTGYTSDDCDGRVALIMTNEYDSGMRSHINLGFETDSMGSSWSRWELVGVIGMDGPLCADGAVRWIADVVYYNSEYMGGDDSTYLELGSEWQIQDGHKLGMTWQFGMHHDETIDFGANVVYALSIM